MATRSGRLASRRCEDQSQREGTKHRGRTKRPPRVAATVHSLIQCFRQLWSVGFGSKDDVMQGLLWRMGHVLVGPASRTEVIRINRAARLWLREFERSGRVC